MKRDIHKFSEWLEKTVRAGIAEKRSLREWKQAQQSAPKASVASNEDPAKAS